MRCGFIRRYLENIHARFNVNVEDDALICSVSTTLVLYNDEVKSKTSHVHWEFSQHLIS